MHESEKGLSFTQAKRACLSLPTGKQAVGRSGILLSSHQKDSGQAGKTNKGKNQLLYTQILFTIKKSFSPVANCLWFLRKCCSIIVWRCYLQYADAMINHV